MAGLSFTINRAPKDVIQEWLIAAIRSLQESGQFELARKLSDNPQPFFQQPHAMAVFMAASAELEKANDRIAKLERALAEIAERLAGDESFLGTVLAEALCDVREENETP
jgi:hypothetical protein